MSLKFIDSGNAVSSIDGERRCASKATCEMCGFDRFIVFVIEGRHQQLQCAQCWTSYCDGSCAAERSLN